MPISTGSQPTRNITTKHSGLPETAPEDLPLKDEITLEISVDWQPEEPPSSAGIRVCCGIRGPFRNSLDRPIGRSMPVCGSNSPSAPFLTNLKCDSRSRGLAVSPLLTVEVACSSSRSSPSIYGKHLGRNVSKSMIDTKKATDYPQPVVTFGPRCASSPRTEMSLPVGKLFNIAHFSDTKTSLTY